MPHSSDESSAPSPPKFGKGKQKIDPTKFEPNVRNRSKIRSFKQVTLEKWIEELNARTGTSCFVTMVWRNSKAVDSWRTLGAGIFSPGKLKMNVPGKNKTHLNRIESLFKKTKLSLEKEEGKSPQSSVEEEEPPQEEEESEEEAVFRSPEKKRNRKKKNET